MTDDTRFISQYLDRLGFEGSAAPDLDTLRQIQYRHVTTIPFENLDIMDKIPLDLDADALFEKIVLRRRGGICYEQNLLFLGLLEKLGFCVTLLSSMHPKYMVEFDHIFLMVDLEGERWLTDVGFADNCLRPLRFTLDRQWQDDGRTRYRFKQESDESYHLLKLKDGEDFVQFIFTLTPRNAPECYERCRWYQTSPKSRFTQGRLVTLDRPDGRITMVDEYHLKTKDTEKTKVEIDSHAQFEGYLRDDFGIIL